MAFVHAFIGSTGTPALGLAPEREKEREGARSETKETYSPFFFLRLLSSWDHERPSIMDKVKRTMGVRLVYLVLTTVQAHTILYSHLIDSFIHTHH